MDCLSAYRAARKIREGSEFDPQRDYNFFGRGFFWGKGGGREGRGGIGMRGVCFFGRRMMDFGFLERKFIP